MGQQPLTHPHIHIRHGEEERGGLLGAARVPGLELLDVLQRIAGEESSPLGQFMEMPHCQLQYVSFFKLRHIFSFCLQSHSHDVFKLKYKL